MDGFAANSSFKTVQTLNEVIQYILDYGTLLTLFSIGFVMFAGGGSNITQQFPSVPIWVGALSMLILVLLVVGMNTGMSAGLRVYETSKVTTERSMLASSINTKLTDILRYAEVRTVDGKQLLTNLEYGLWDVTFEEEAGKIQIYFYDKTGSSIAKKTPLINSDSYSDFKVSETFNVSYNPNGYFDISYTLEHTGNPSYSDAIEAVVRVMNE